MCNGAIDIPKSCLISLQVGELRIDIWHCILVMQEHVDVPQSCLISLQVGELRIDIWPSILVMPLPIRACNTDQAIHFLKPSRRAV